MLLALLSALFLAFLAALLEMVFLAQSQWKAQSFLPLFLRILILTLVFWFVISGRNFSMLVSFLSILLPLAIIEALALLLLRQRFFRFPPVVLFFFPLSLTRAIAIALIISAGIPAWWAILCGIIAFLSLYPIVIALQVYEHQKKEWENLAEATGLLAKDRWYRRQIGMWRRTYAEAQTLLRVGYRNWVSKDWNALMPLFSGIACLFSLLYVAPGSFFGWFLYTTVLHGVGK